MLKSVKFTDRVATIKVEDRRTQGISKESMTEIAALSALMGAYNPLRRYATEGNDPIDIEKLKGFQQEFNNLIWKVAREMNVDTGLLHHGSL